MSSLRRSFCAALSVAIGCVAFAADGPLPDRAHVYVEGRGEVEYEPDEFELQLMYSALDMEMPKAKALVDERTRGFIRACADLGIGQRDVSASDLRFEDQYDYRDDQRVLLGTQVVRNVGVTLHDLSKYSELMRAAIGSDVDSITRTSLRSKSSNAMITKAQVLALDDARKRATELAVSAQRKLGKVYSISEFALRQDESYRLQPSRGVYGNLVSGGSLAMADSVVASEIFEPGTISARATVYVVFLLEDQ